MSLTPQEREAQAILFGRSKSNEIKEPKEEVDRYFGEWIKVRRTGNALSCQKAVEQTGIPLDRWEQIEQGEVFPSEQEVLKIASFLEVKRIEALSAAGYTNNYAPDVDLAQVLAACIAQLPPERHEFFRESIRWTAHDLVENLLVNREPYEYPTSR